MYSAKCAFACSLAVASVIFACAATVGGCGNDQETAGYNQLGEQLEAAAAESTTDDPIVFVLEGREWYHKQGCQRLRRDPSKIRQGLRSEAQASGLVACAVCRP